MTVPANYTDSLNILILNLFCVFSVFYLNKIMNNLEISFIDFHPYNEVSFK